MIFGRVNAWFSAMHCYDRQPLNWPWMILAFWYSCLWIIYPLKCAMNLMNRLWQKCWDVILDIRLQKHCDFCLTCSYLLSHWLMREASCHFWTALWRDSCKMDLMSQSTVTGKTPRLPTATQESLEVNCSQSSHKMMEDSWQYLLQPCEKLRTRCILLTHTWIPDTWNWYNKHNFKSTNFDIICYEAIDTK